VRNWVIVTASSTCPRERAETPTSAREAVKRAETSSSAPSSEVVASLPCAGAVVTVLSSCRVLAGQGGDFGLYTGGSLLGGVGWQDSQIVRAIVAYYKS